MQLFLFNVLITNLEIITYLECLQLLNHEPLLTYIDTPQNRSVLKILTLHKVIALIILNIVCCFRCFYFCLVQCRQNAQNFYFQELVSKFLHCDVVSSQLCLFLDLLFTFLISLTNISSYRLLQNNFPKTTRYCLPQG